MQQFFALLLGLSPASRQLQRYAAKGGEGSGKQVASSQAFSPLAAQAAENEYPEQAT
jgi:hypothetical protein